MGNNEIIEMALLQGDSKIITIEKLELDLKVFKERLLSLENDI